ncbi:hypothetical protein BKA69DRAFT_621909 [Paraphysoderma sedebokerense]|nr:hypothetical protein BKA69DRAFT_621909 [Paraphysoderma sedebokerense]
MQDSSIRELTMTLGIRLNYRHTIAPPENTHAKVFIQVLDVWNKNVPQNCEIYYTLHLDNQVQKSKPSMNEKRLSNAGAKFNEMLLLNASNNFKMELKLYLKFPESAKPQTKSKPNKSFFSSLKRTGFLSSSKNASGAAALGDHFNGLTTYLGSVHFDLHAVNFGKCTKTFPVVIDKMNARVMSGYLDGKKAGEVAAEVTMKIGVFREWPMVKFAYSFNHDYRLFEMKIMIVVLFEMILVGTNLTADRSQKCVYNHDRTDERKPPITKTT